jgi:hypothetical protein
MTHINYNTSTNTKIGDAFFPTKFNHDWKENCLLFYQQLLDAMGANILTVFIYIRLKKDKFFLIKFINQT